MTLSSLWKLAGGASPPIAVAADLCKRSRFAKSDCERCREICPQGAITLHPEPQVSSDCSDCGLCVSVCPTEVFRPLLSSDADRLSEIGGLARDGPARGGNDSRCLQVRCGWGERQGEAELSVPCLGSLSENVLVGAALAGFEKLVLTRGNCAECPLRSGASLIDGLLDDTRSLLKSLDLERIEVTVEERQRGRPAPLSRKDLFRRARNRLRPRGASEGSTAEREGHSDPTRDTAAAHASSPRRALLGSLARRRSLVEPTTVEPRPAGRWARIRIDERRCSACGTCSAVCPTGALSMVTGEGSATLSLLAAGCTNCGLCLEVCDEGAVGRRAEWSVADLFDTERRVLAEVPLRVCAGCGESVTSTQKALCPTCERRGVQVF